jgi:CDGSH-type Zn-finger protein
MADPVMAAKGPAQVDVVEGETYWWCACGKSANQPFYDGSHKGSEFEPVRYEAKATRTVFMCQCKLTKNGPLCDGAHNNL